MFGLLWHVLLLKTGLAVPLSAAIDITDRCNFRCNMCGIWSKEVKYNLDPAVFRARFVKSKLLRRVRYFNFGGGEPFLIPELADYIDTVAKYSKPDQVRIVTNGYLTKTITDTMKILLDKYDLSFGIKISIDGMGQTHNRIRGVADAFEKAMDTVNSLINLRKIYGKRLGINLGFTVSSINCGELESVYRLCKEKNIGFFFKPVLCVDKFCRGDFDRNLFLTSDQTKDLIKFGKKISNDLSGFSFKEKVVYRMYYRFQNRFLANPRRLVPCYSGKASFYLTPDGNVSACLMMNDSMGNINKADFDEIWLSGVSDLIRKNIRRLDCACLTSCDTFPSLLVHKFPFYF